MSFLIRIFIPWSASEHERGVDSGFVVFNSSLTCYHKAASHLPFQGISLRYKHRRVRSILTCSDARCSYVIRTASAD
jgi:hypothetical protein